MPITYRIDPVQRVILTEASGVLTDEDVLAHKALLLKDPAFDPTYGELSDIRKIERLEVTSAGVQAMAQHDATNADKRHGHRLALVVSGEVVYGMARMYQIVSQQEDSGVGVFRTIDEASEWLGIRRE
jgi:hypothetical protein